MIPPIIYLWVPLMLLSFLIIGWVDKFLVLNLLLIGLQPFLSFIFPYCRQMSVVNQRAAVFHVNMAVAVWKLITAPTLNVPAAMAIQVYGKNNILFFYLIICSFCLNFLVFCLYRKSLFFFVDLSEKWLMFCALMRPTCFMWNISKLYPTMLYVSKENIHF